MKLDFDNPRSDWTDVTDKYPCPICGKPDWCGTTKSRTFCMCMRIEEGSMRTLDNGGHLHRLVGGRRFKTLRPMRTVMIPSDNPSRGDLPRLVRRYERAVTHKRLRLLARKLGVTTASLRRLRIGWADDFRAWAFPMTTAAGKVIGIRLRRQNGRKFSVAGGREGLFMPINLCRPRRLLITEGPTDCAALLDLGFCAVGRPSCTGGVRHLILLAEHLRPAEVVVIADRDEPGQNGAWRLVRELMARVPAVRIITPPPFVKDARAWVNGGASADDVRRAIKAAPVQSFHFTTRVISGKGAFRA